MKHLIITFISLLALASCNSFRSKDEIEAFIPGTYIAYYENEFHKTHDTLFIQQNANTQNVYTIIRRYYYTTVVDGRELTPTYKKENWAALYDAADKILTEQRHGAIISFSPGQNQLTRGTRVYKKID